MEDQKNQSGVQPVASGAVWWYRIKRYGLRLLLCGFILFAIGSFIVQGDMFSQQADELKGIQSAIAGEREKQTMLMATLEYQQTDEFIERYVRDNYGYVKPGEIRFVDAGGQ